MMVTVEKTGVLAEEIMAGVHTDCCYLFDLFDEGMLIASRAPAAQSPQAESLKAYLNLGTWEEVRAHLLSYSTLPMVIDSRLGTGLVIPTLAPASSLGVLCVPTIPRDLLIRLAKSGACGEFAFASSTADIRARMSKRTSAYMLDFLEWMERLKDIFYTLTLPKDRNPREPINEFLHDHMLRLARYVGCPIECADRGEIMHYGDFDYPLFIAFFLGSLCLARRVATDRSVRVMLDMTAFGGTVSVAMAKREEMCAEHMQELVTLRAIAERKNILFDYAEGEGQLCIRISPVSKDWSYLELKAPNLFEWPND